MHPLLMLAVMASVATVGCSAHPTSAVRHAQLGDAAICAKMLESNVPAAATSEVAFDSYTQCYVVSTRPDTQASCRCRAACAAVSSEDAASIFCDNKTCKEWRPQCPSGKSS